MKKQTKNIAVTLVMAVYFFGMMCFCLIRPSDKFSISERRQLAQFPEITKESILSGAFMAEFEKYTLDQFPMRDRFRTLKSITALYGFRQLDNNDIYVADGYASAMQYPLKESSIDWAVSKFQNIYEKYLAGKDMNVYYSIIPDKNYFLAEKHGYPSMDYDRFYSLFREKLTFMQEIDIRGLLDVEDFYKTDTHWRQEKLLDVAEKIGGDMGFFLNWEYQIRTLEQDFYGVYYGQSSLPLPAEKIQYLWNDGFSDCEVYDFQNNREISIYDMEKAAGNDPYEMFLSGPLSLITIENPNAFTDKELILFRDSFGSSLAPLLVEGYAKITLVDIRYLQSGLLDKFITFENQDVLFLYSSLVLNNSETLKKYG